MLTTYLHINQFTLNYLQIMGACTHAFTQRVYKHDSGSQMYFRAPLGYMPSTQRRLSQLH
jgi:hypothetical protein